MALAAALCAVFVSRGAAVFSAPLAVHTSGVPRVAMVIPDGFEPVALRRGSPVFAMYRRARDEVLLVFVRLPGPLEQDGRDVGALWRAAREADPFRFEDRPVRFRALGFDVDGVRGVSTAEGVSSVRHAALVPTDGLAIAVLSVAPAPRDADARGALDQVLRSMRGPTNWRTPLRRAVDLAASVGLIAGVGLGSLYALLLATVFRKRPDRARVLRGAMLGTAGVAWSVFAAFWLAESGLGARAFGIAVLGLGVVLCAQGLGMIRRRAT
ncbi:MAG: hypothetical protein WCJ30_07970 [Deltaproteobacteria bacterium]